MRVGTMLVAVSALGACLVQASPDTQWQTYRIKEAGATFDMPAQPKPIEKTKERPINAFALRTADGVLMAGFSEAMPFQTDKGGAQKTLKEFEQGMLSSAKLQVVGTREVEVQGRMGRILVLQRGEEEFWRVIAVVNGDRIVFQMYIGTKAGLSSTTTAKFFNSLKFEK
ncbi:MAG: hypothetical protein M9921_12800 [Fimbriimonadaceae bacterium]|nr:hypothetical protein [Chthonomonadaceae bacterium]MCO5297727.1 hypothetical protein [Fimbriimonadaceae bacterium]